MHNTTKSHGLSPRDVLGSLEAAATRPDGTVEPLIWINDWIWQGQYRLAKPVKLANGTHPNLEAIYDNSADNLANPSSPPKDVRYGRKTTDEMCLRFLQVALDRPEDEQRLRKTAMQNIIGKFASKSFLGRTFGVGKSTDN